MFTLGRSQMIVHVHGQIRIDVFNGTVDAAELAAGFL